jgi:hypothetical protein
MQKTLPIIALMLAFLTTTLAASVTVVSRFEPSTVAVGEYSAFIVSVNGSSTSKLDFNLPTVEGLLISDSPNVSNQVSIVNGTISSFVRYIYTVRPSKEGAYTLPSIDAKLDGAKCTIPGATLTVTAPGKDTLDALRVELETPESLYVGESANATLHILVRDDLRAVPGSINPRRSGDGIMQEPIDNASVREEHVMRGTTPYDGIVVPLKITALTVGKQLFAYDSDIQVRTVRKRDGEIDDLQDPMDRMMQQMRALQENVQGGTTRVLHARAEKTIEVKPLPAGAPASFDGAIGSFEVYGNLSTHKTKVGEPIELTVEILGDSGFKQLSAPKVDQIDGWRNYPPTEENKVNETTNQMLGKRYKFLFSPQKAGDLVTPSAHFSFFDPSTGKYVEKTINGELVHVEDVPSMHVTAQTFAPAAQNVVKKKVAVISNEGFHPISLLDSPASPDALRPPQKKKWFWLAQLIPVAIIVWGIVVPVMRKRAEKDPLAKQRKFFTKAAAAAKSKALAAAKKNDANAFFTQARKCLQNAVCAKAPKRKPETVSAADVVQTIAPDDAALRRETNLIFNGGEAMRYGSVGTPVNELAGKLTEIAKQLGVE